jgi:hypothetical protein
LLRSCKQCSSGLRRVPALDDIAFDRLTRLFSATGSRRGAARAIVGTLLGGALLRQNGEVVADSGRSRSGKKGKGKGSGRGRRNDTCTKVGKAPKRGKPCCKGLVRDGAGQCAAAPPTDCPARSCEDLSDACGLISDGCGGALDCGDCSPDQVCCGSVCVTGVCCVNRQCGPSGNTCTGNECFCGGGLPCTDDTPTCCLPGVCTNTLIDEANCGGCGIACEVGESCCYGECVDTKSDQRNCGECGIMCVIGETCVSSECKCGADAGPCDKNQTCDGAQCVACTENDFCGGLCQPCPDPPGLGLGIPNDGFCCSAGFGDDDSFCSCNGQCCKGKCFFEGPSGSPTGEFCCEGEGKFFCPHESDSAQDLCCPTADCNCFNQSGRFGSNRRPGR